MTLLSLPAWIATSLEAPLFAADPQAASEDHPLVVVSFASFDRLLARASSLTGASAEDSENKKLLSLIADGDESFGKLIESPGIDPTRPIGIMSFCNWSQGEENALPQLDEFQDAISDPFSFLIDGLMQLAIENSMVVCIPCRNQNELLNSVNELFGEEPLSPIPNRPNWYETKSKDPDEQYHAFFTGKYFLFMSGEHWDRKYPDFESMAKGSLGKNGFVYSLYRKGLPKFVSEDLVDALKQAHAATQQRQDDETDLSFRTRTMFGPLQRQMLDVTLSHIDEFRITGHVDSKTKRLTIESELIGPKGGKLAKACESLSGKSRTISTELSDDAIIEANLSLPLPPLLWKPVAEGLRSYGEVFSNASPKFAGLPGLCRTFASTIDSGRIDMQMSLTTTGEGLLSMKLANNPSFPEQMRLLLESFETLQSDAIHRGAVKLDADIADKWPIHRLRSSILDGLDFGFIGWSDFTPNDTREIENVDVESFKDTDAPVKSTSKIAVPAQENEPQNYLWLTSTPTGLWIALTAPENRDCPEWLKSAVQSNMNKQPAATTVTRSSAPIRITFRGLGASLSPEAAKKKEESEKNGVQPVKAAVPVGIDFEESNELQKPEQRSEIKFTPSVSSPEEIAKQQAILEKQLQNARERGDIIRDFPNTITLELKPTDTGLKMSITFEEAHFLWFSKMTQQTMEERQQAN